MSSDEHLRRNENAQGHYTKQRHGSEPFSDSTVLRCLQKRYRNTDSGRLCVLSRDIALRTIRAIQQESYHNRHVTIRTWTIRQRKMDEMERKPCSIRFDTAKYHWRKQSLRC